MAGVAVLSDIHGVLPALDAALGTPAVRQAEHVVVTGDITAGPQPVEVLDRLLGLGERVTLVRGNADREMVELVDGGTGEIPDPIAPWAAGQLAARPDLVELLRTMPHPVTENVAGFGPVLFCHATPRDDLEVVLVDSRPQRWNEVFADLPDEVRTVVCGHTHMPYVRLVDGRTVVNPGSVGMPYGSRGAHWALLHDGAVTLGRAEFDVETARAAIHEACTYPAIVEWTDEFLYARNSDFDAITAFGPRDGRLSS